ncbi:hypothetical protein C8R44DRAFT_728207 [Mycena epipterygia]|nr:hypothetical protein C8R44DRAFT_728207 [Mycena epipterygia]
MFIERTNEEYVLADGMMSTSTRESQVSPVGSRQRAVPVVRSASEMKTNSGAYGAGNVFTPWGANPVEAAPPSQSGIEPALHLLRKQHSLQAQAANMLQVIGNTAPGRSAYFGALGRATCREHVMCHMWKLGGFRSTASATEVRCNSHPGT